MVCHYSSNTEIIMKQNIEPPRRGRWGDNFVGSWKTLNFHLPLGGRTLPNGEFKIFHTFGWTKNKVY